MPKYQFSLVSMFMLMSALPGLGSEPVKRGIMAAGRNAPATPKKLAAPALPRPPPGPSMLARLAFTTMVKPPMSRMSEKICMAPEIAVM